MELVIDILGWLGSIEVILAYALSSYQKIKSDSWTFLLLNFTGGIFLILYTVYYEAYANTFINVVWVIVAVPAMIKMIRK